LPGYRPSQTDGILLAFYPVEGLDYEALKKEALEKLQFK